MRQMQNFCVDVGAAAVKICANTCQFVQMTERHAPNASLHYDKNLFQTIEKFFTVYVR